MLLLSSRYVLYGIHVYMGPETQVGSTKMLWRNSDFVVGKVMGTSQSRSNLLGTGPRRISHFCPKALVSLFPDLSPSSPAGKCVIIV
jgi:hypothetical protein